MNQPLLLNRSKKTRVRSLAEGRLEKVEDIICLIPELCCITGLTEDIRKDFRIMKELANHTRCTPAQRYESLKRFISLVRDTPGVSRHLTNWGLEIDDDTIEVTNQKKNKFQIF